MKAPAKENSQNSVSVFFILDGPKYQAQAILLAATLRYFNSDRYKIIAYLPEAQHQDQGMARITARIMSACDTEVRIVTDRQINGRTPFNGYYPHGNKILAATEPRDTDIAVFLDSDTVCCGPLDFEDLIMPGEMRAVVSDYATGWYNMKRWIKAYRHFDLEVPEQRVQFHRGRRLISPPYYNAGMVGFREDVAEDQHLGKLWLDTAHRFDWDFDLKYERNAVDQLTLPIAATRLGLQMPLTSTAYNYNIMRRPFDPQLSLKILHYHRFVDLWAWPFGQEVPGILAKVVGPRLASRALRVFRDYYRMPPDFDRKFDE